MNFVCIVFEIGDKMLTLSSMENLIVQCNHFPRLHGDGKNEGNRSGIVAVRGQNVTNLLPN